MTANALIIAFVGLLVFLAHLFVLLFRKTRVPDVLLLILIGFLIGPVLGLALPEHFGKVGPVFAQVALAIILFEGGREARLDVLRANWKGCLGLILPAFAAAFALGFAFMRWVAGLDIESSLFFGAILGSTAPSVVVPLVKQLRMQRGPALVMMLESALADVLCLVLVLGFLEAHAAGQMNLEAMVSRVAVSFLGAGICGAAFGLAWSLLLTRLRAIQNNIFMTLALVFILYGTMDAMHLSGGVAALAFGMTIGNAGTIAVPGMRWTRRLIPARFTEREMAFFSEAVFLIKTFFFVYLGLSLHLKDYRVLASAFALMAGVLVLRIPIVRFAMAKTTTRRDASLMAVLVPKGLAAAVLAALPLQHGWSGGEFIRDLSYSLIFFSILGSALLVFLVEATPLSRAYAYCFRGFPETLEEPPESGEFPGLTEPSARAGAPLDPGPADRLRDPRDGRAA